MLIIDIHYLGWRAYHSMGNLTTETGEGTGIVLGILSQALRLSRQWKDPEVIFTCDSQDSLRKRLFPAYKKKPAETDKIELANKADAIRQINLVKRRLLGQMGFNNVFEYRGYEADDIQAQIVMHRTGDKIPLVITNDDDILQLLEYCSIYSPSSKTLTTKRDFVKEYGLAPGRWADVKRLAGCTSDGVPGIKGIGPGTALKYLKGQLKPKSKKLQDIRNARRDGSVDLWDKLVRLPFEGCPVPVIVEDEFSYDGFLAVCEEFEFSKMESEAGEWEKWFTRHS